MVERPAEANTWTPPYVDLQKGSIVQYNGIAYEIDLILDLESVIAIEERSGRRKYLTISQLQPLPMDKETAGIIFPVPLDGISSSDWKTAHQRLEMIQPLLDMTRRGRKDVMKHAHDVGCDVTTLYRWLKRYLPFRDLSTLIPQKRGWTKGRTRLAASAEAVIEEVIEDYYLTPQRPSEQHTIDEIKRRCLERHIQPPNKSTIRTRIQRIPEEERLRRRGQRRKARDKFRPVPGHFPGADFPLAVVQIDHTLVDLILVDDEYRKPVGRPWISLAMDVYSRMVVGYYLSFDDPSEASVGFCVSHAVLPKEGTMSLLQVRAEWPVWGIPKTIHVDNGPDFRSEGFRRSCTKHGIHVEYRPVRQPEYGGHIERLLGTLSKKIHGLPGTTFSSIKERDDYDSDKHAIFTKSEFEKWLVTLICKYYHHRRHAEIEALPIDKWETGVLGNDTTPGIGLPPRPTAHASIVYDFLPSFERTVQRIGVTIEGMTYYSEALRPWIGAPDPQDPKRKLRLTFRRDPRDITTLRFYDPELNEYLAIPTADMSLSSMSIWEFREVKRRLKQSGRPENPFQIAQVLTELREQTRQAGEKTKSARRKGQKRREHEKKQTPQLEATMLPAGESTMSEPSDEFSDEPIDATYEIF